MHRSHFRKRTCRRNPGRYADLTRTAHRHKKKYKVPCCLTRMNSTSAPITIVYTLLPDGNVSVSVHSHKDAPIVKTFPETEVPLPERVSRVINTLREIWPGSEVSATFALLPKGALEERTITVSVRVNRDTPLVQSCLESEISFPGPDPGHVGRVESAPARTRDGKHPEGG